ncbi:hypothetical protein M422DRAFT_781574 [Sphaerobolus stellatus SS14]|uniref:Major facilitator superfamily (MFS) profile domain-containing protein n=1 Tax=Sphaerobolus stellatus (strain SS14) TaxID=990650 RepID=A0A0C9V8F4_SPHS4|nr:hypothetical protein M422DRAFT_781574 [Sphaerobolus stellatus SS14]
MAADSEKPSSLSPPQSSTPAQDDTFDGGRQAWATVIGGFLIVATTFGYANSFGVYQDFYTQSHTASSSAISWIGSTQLFFLQAMALPAGKLLDMGYFRATTLVGSLIYVFSLFMVSISHPDKYYQLYLSQGLGMGIGAGLLYVPSVAVQAHHWRARRALAMGSSIGGIIFPIMLNQLFKSRVGFHWGVRASAFIVLGMLIVANLLMSAKSSRAGPRVNPDIKGIITDVPYLLAILGVFICFWGVFFPYFYLQLFAMIKGVNTQVAFYTLAILNAAALPGRVLPNMLADRFGPFNVAIPLVALCGIMIFALFGVKTVASTVIFSVIYGFASGAFLSLCAPAIAVLARDPSEVGIRFGIAFFFSSFGVLMGNPVIGALLGNTFHWNRAIVWSGVSIMAGTAFLLLTRAILVRRRGSQLI